MWDYDKTIDSYQQYQITAIAHLQMKKNLDFAPKRKLCVLGVYLLLDGFSSVRTHVPTPTPIHVLSASFSIGAEWLFSFI